MTNGYPALITCTQFPRALTKRAVFLLPQAVVEAANAATTLAGDAVLRSRGIPVLPDIYANGGGVVVSFFEWVQNLQNFQWDDEDIERKLDR